RYSSFVRRRPRLGRSRIPEAVRCSGISGHCKDARVAALQRSIAAVSVHGRTGSGPRRYFVTSVGVLTGDPSLPDEPLEVLRDSLRHIDRAEWEEVREPGEAEVILFAEHHGEATRDTTRVIPSLAIYRRHAARIVV